MKRPSLLMSSNQRLFTSIGVGDTSIFRHDPLLGRYVVDAKFNLYLPEALMKAQDIPRELGKNRIRGTMLESDDLTHWTAPRMILFPDDRDTRDAQIYGHISFVYESMWLGVARIMQVERTGWKQVELELSYSRDGRQWSRPTQRRPFLPLGEVDSWEADYSDVALNGPLLVGDELWFYYRGSRSSERDKVKDFRMATGLARLRRDGFVSLDATARSGTVTTRPLTYAGRSLFVNATCSPGGSIRAALLSRKSQPIERFSLADAIPLTTDSIGTRLNWASGDRLPPSTEEPVRVQFQLQNAKLFSFWIQ